MTGKKTDESQLDLFCPKCGAGLKLLKQARSWLEGNLMFDADANREMGYPAMCNLWCETCGDMTASIWVEINDMSRVVKVPALKEIGEPDTDTIHLTWPSRRT